MRKGVAVEILRGACLCLCCSRSGLFLKKSGFFLQSLNGPCEIAISFPPIFQDGCFKLNEEREVSLRDRSGERRVSCGVDTTLCGSVMEGERLEGSWNLLRALF